jgi:uncharacterized protein involved in exopolysaccharide biosynthesis
VALKQAQRRSGRATSSCTKEKDDLQTKFEEEKAQIQARERTVAHRAGWSQRSSQQSTSLCDRLREKGGRPVEHQVAQLAEAIQQLQQRIADLELQTVPKYSRMCEIKEKQLLEAQLRESRPSPWNVNN